MGCDPKQEDPPDQEAAEAAAEPLGRLKRTGATEVDWRLKRTGD
jgi:hypothetical protein